MSPVTFNVGIVGCGPRGAFINMSSLIVALAEEGRINEIHKHGNYFEVTFHTFEKKPYEHRATGGAFATNCHGVINTSIAGPNDVNIPNLDKIADEHKNLVDIATNLQGLVAKHVGENYDSLMSEYRRVNTAAAANLQYATRDDGTVDTAISCVTRGTQGAVMQYQFDHVMKNGKEAVPFMKHVVHYETEVVSYHVTDPAYPRLITRKVGTGIEEEHTFDHIVIAEGTTMKDPVPDDLLPLTYLGEANFDAIQAFYASHDLLRDDGSLKPDARILVTGMGPSAIDKATIGSRSAAFARHSETDPSGFEFIAEKVSEYADTFVNISRHPGHSMATRHTYSTRWPGPTYFPLKPEIVQAAAMTGSPDALPALVRIVIAATARALNMTPAEIYPLDVSAFERQSDYFQQNLVHFSATTPAGRARTQAGCLRSGVRTLIERANPGEDASRVSEDEVFMANRAGWPWMRHLAAWHSKPEKLVNQSNAAYYQAWEYFCHVFMTASPAPIAHYFSGMFTHRVTGHHQASFRDLRRSPETGKVLCGTAEFDCVLGSRLISIEGSMPHKSLAGQVKESRPGKAAFAKNRLYMTKEGALTSVTELGVAGEGVMDKDKDGKTILIDQDWEDTNSHHAAVNITPTVVKYILSKAALKANGCKNPAEEIHTRYLNSLPSDDEYDAFVKCMENHHREFSELLAYVDFCTEYAGDDREKFAAAYGRIKHSKMRDDFVKGSEDFRDPESAAMNYYAALQSIPAFKPLSKQEYFSTYIDQTAEEMQQTWNGICDDIVAGNIA